MSDSGKSSKGTSLRCHEFVNEDNIIEEAYGKEFNKYIKNTIADSQQRKQLIIQCRNLGIKNVQDLEENYDILNDGINYCITKNTQQKITEQDRMRFNAYQEKLKRDQEFNLSVKQDISDAVKQTQLEDLQLKKQQAEERKRQQQAAQAKATAQDQGTQNLQQSAQSKPPEQISLLSNTAADKKVVKVGVSEDETSGLHIRKPNQNELDNIFKPYIDKAKQMIAQLKSQSASTSQGKKSKSKEPIDSLMGEGQNNTKLKKIKLQASNVAEAKATEPQKAPALNKSATTTKQTPPVESKQPPLVQSELEALKLAAIQETKAIPTDAKTILSKVEKNKLVEYINGCIENQSWLIVKKMDEVVQVGFPIDSLSKPQIYKLQKLFQQLNKIK